MASAEIPRFIKIITDLIVNSITPMRSLQVRVITSLLYLLYGTRAVASDFVLYCKSIHSNLVLYIVLFVSSEFYHELPLDSISLWASLLLANSSCCKSCSGLSPPSYNPYGNYAFAAHRNPIFPVELSGVLELRAATRYRLQ